MSLMVLAIAGLTVWSGCGDDGSGGTPDEADAGIAEDGTADVPTEDAAPDSTRRDTTAPDVGVEDEPDAVETPDIDRPDVPIVEDSGTPDAPPIDDPMRIVAVNPERGPTSGGTEILVIGLSFTFDTDIYLGGVICENIDFVDETKIICDTPPNTAGFYDVKAINNVLEASLSGAYTYFAPVTIEAIDPDTGPTTGGMPATIFGSGLTASTQVSIGGRLALNVEVVDSTEVRLLTPPGVAGLARVQVSNENGLDAIDDGFVYYTPLEIEQVLPGAGQATGGDDVIIRGAGFSEEDILDVRFGLLSADFEVLSDDEIAVTSPPGPGNSWVDVSVDSRLAGEVASPDAFYYYGEAGDYELFNVVPTAGTSDGGTVVVLSGVGLDDVDSVAFGGVDGTIDEQSDRYIIATTPAGDVGLVNVRVRDGGANRILRDAFTYLPSIGLDDVAPSSGPVEGGTEVVITGSGFVEGTTVRFGPLPAMDVDVINGGEIQAVTPPGAAGVVPVLVTTPDGVQGQILRGFTYTTPLEVYGLAPSRGSIAGETYVIIRGSGFVGRLDLTFGDQPAPSFEVLDSATIAVYTPPNFEGYVDVTVATPFGDPAVSPERFLYYDPLSIVGGSWGDEILGSVNVTVISNRGQPLAEAFVMLDVRSEATYSAETDVNGQATLSGPDLSGEQVVTATRLGFSSSTVHDVNAENITLVLSCVPENQCGSTDDCREGFICTCGPPYSGGFPGVCLEEDYCGFEPDSQEAYDNACVPDFPPAPFGIITGQLTGIHKVADPGPDERIIGAVFTTDPHPFQSSDVDPGTGNVLENNGPYTLRSRLGEIALVAVCGLYNDVTEVFHPFYMGVQRGLFIVEGESYDIDIDCDIELNQRLSIKSLNPPFTPTGPDVFIHTPYLHFGSEGYFGGIVTLTGTDEILTSEPDDDKYRDGFAPLEGELAGLDYYIIGAAYTGTSWPYSIAILEGVSEIDEMIVLPEFIPVANLTTPAPGGLLVERYFEWELETDARPDFYYLLIYDFFQTTYWDVFVPGDQRRVNLPVWPEDAETGLFPSGPLILQILAVDAKSFDFDNFDFNDFSITNWEAYSVNAFLFNNP
jgi:hypothetical protein